MNHVFTQQRRQHGSRRYLRAERPDEHNPVVINSTNVTTWCVKSKEPVTGLHVFENDNVTGESYR